jgi:hypothetical protein
MYGQFPQGGGRPSGIRRGSFAKNDRSGSTYGFGCAYVEVPGISDK